MQKIDIFASLEDQGNTFPELCLKMRITFPKKFDLEHFSAGKRARLLLQFDDDDLVVTSMTYHFQLSRETKEACAIRMGNLV